MTDETAPTGEKLCRKCGETKPLAAFSKGRAKCKPCRAEYYRKWNEENRDRRAEYYRKWSEENRDRRAETRRKWREENPDKTAENTRRRRARKRGMPDDGTTLVDLITRDGPLCYLCGHDTTGCTNICYRANIEHIIPLDPGTHTADNLRVACGRCNSRKGRRLLADLDLPWFCDCPGCEVDAADNPVIGSDA